MRTITVAAALALLAVGARAAHVHRYDALIFRDAQYRGLDPRLVKAVVAVESEFVPDAVSPAGARGLMQVMPATGRELGVSPRALYHPAHNVWAGTVYLSWLYALAWRQDGLSGPCCLGAPPETTRRVVAAYHAGPRALRGRAAWPASTRAYVRKVMRLYRSSDSFVRRPPAPPRPAAPAKREESYAALPKKRLMPGPGDRGEGV